MLRRLLARAVTSLLTPDAPPPATPDEPDPKSEEKVLSARAGDELLREIDRLRQLVDQKERQRKSLFDVILVMEAQRDEFKSMFYEQASEHQNAQISLEAALYAIRHKFNNLRAYLQDHDKKAIAEESLLADPIGVSKRFRDSMQRLANDPWPDPASPKKLLDGDEERARVAPDLALIFARDRILVLEKAVEALQADRDRLQAKAQQGPPDERIRVAEEPTDARPT